MWIRRRLLSYPLNSDGQEIMGQHVAVSAIEDIKFPNSSANLFTVYKIHNV